ncbi:MAG: hypothetical protein ACI81P_000105 [Neolewinella sp.]|jgi:hypothetical protein
MLMFHRLDQNHDGGASTRTVIKLMFLNGACPEALRPAQSYNLTNSFTTSRPHPQNITASKRLHVQFSTRDDGHQLPANNII